MDTRHEPPADQAHRRTSTLDDFVAARRALGVPAPTSTGAQPYSPRRRSPAAWLAIAGTTGLVLLPVGLLLVAVGFDATFLVTDPDPVWEFLTVVGALLLALGAGLLAVSIVGLLVIAATRLVRRAGPV